MKPEKNSQFMASLLEHSPEAATETIPTPSEVVNVAQHGISIPGAEHKAEITTEMLVEKVIPESTYTSFVTNPESGQLLKVINIDLIKSNLVKEVHIGGVRLSRKKILQTLFEKHKEDVVLTTEQVKRGDYEVKPLFFYPKSPAEATDPITIADKLSRHPLLGQSGR